MGNGASRTEDRKHISGYVLFATKKRIFAVLEIIHTAQTAVRRWTERRNDETDSVTDRADDCGHGDVKG